MKNLIKLFILFAVSLYAGKVDVMAVKHDCNKDMVCTFSVTLKHNDTGWKHYADKYDIIANGKIIATRVLFHPHVDEQPFTRSISNVKIPQGVKFVLVRGHDLVHGYGGKELRVSLKP